MTDEPKKVNVVLDRKLCQEYIYVDRIVYDDGCIKLNK